MTLIGKTVLTRQVSLLKIKKEKRDNTYSKNCTYGTGAIEKDM